MVQPLFLSWSALKTWEECHQREALLRGKKRPEGTDIRNYVHGTIADRVVRKWLDDETDHKPGQMQDYVDEIFLAETTPVADGGNADGVVHWRGKNDKFVMKNTVRDICSGAEPFLFQHVIPYEWQAGVRFKTELQIPYLDGSPAWVHLVGEMDILVKRAEYDYLGIDLKGTRNDQYWRQTLGQAIFYDIATKCMLGVPCTMWAFLQPLCAEPWLPVYIDDEVRRTMVTRIHKMAVGRWTKDEMPKEGNGGCSSCDVKHGCVKYKPTVDPAGKHRLSFAQAAQFMQDVKSA